jgi:hypothetical protein
MPKTGGNACFPAFLVLFHDGPSETGMSIFELTPTGLCYICSTLSAACTETSQQRVRQRGDVLSEEEGKLIDVASMSVHSKAELVASSSHLLGSEGTASDEVIQIFQKTSGRDLLLLKRTVDGDIGLHELVYKCANSQLRQSLLGYFGKSLCDNHTVVLCDIDDTFWASWKDRRYPTTTVYPGCVQVSN